MSLPPPERPRVPSITAGLRIHPATSAASPAGMLLATMYASPGGGAVLEFKLEERRLDTLRIPPAAEPGPADELWRHTCFEAFIGIKGEPGYREFNFSPSGQWAIYDFRAWRERDADYRPATAPQLRFAQDGSSAWLEAHLPASVLPAVPPGTELEIGLAAIIERADGELEYWAVHHPAAQPDFHARSGFVLMLKTWAETDGKRR